MCTLNVLIEEELPGKATIPVSDMIKRVGLNHELHYDKQVIEFWAQTNFLTAIVAYFGPRYMAYGSDKPEVRRSTRTCDDSRV